MLDIIFLYIAYLHNRSSKDSLKTLLKVSESAKALLGVMTAEHKHLIAFIIHFIKLSNAAYKHRFSAAANKVNITYITKHFKAKLFACLLCMFRT